MDFEKLRIEVQQTILLRKAEAEHVAAKNKRMALSQPAYAQAHRALQEQILTVARLMYEQKDTTAALKKQAELEQAAEAELQKIGLSSEALQPQYHCTICNDTGKVAGRPCRCFEALLQAKLNNSGIDRSATFDALDKTEKKGLKKAGEDFVQGTSAYRNMLLCGPCGTGKTYFASCIVNALLDRGEPVSYLSAYDLNDAFLQAHLSTQGVRAQQMQRFDTPYLVIDDLGTEPIYRNVTLEYLYHVINDRQLKDLCTVISTNLSLQELLTRYGDRIFSRLTNKRNTLIYPFHGSDARHKKTPEKRD